ncbi:hypothetical protein ACOME3_002807 [Neoechinorhynchus agilis]
MLRSLDTLEIAKLSEFGRQYVSQICPPAAIICVLLFISGQMWNVIRGPPLLIIQHDRIGIFASGMRMQTQIETLIVMVIYGLSSICLILMDNISDRDKRTLNNDDGNENTDTVLAKLSCFGLFALTTLLRFFFQVKLQ